MTPAKTAARGRVLHPADPSYRHVPGASLLLLLGVWLATLPLRWTYGDPDAWLDARWNDVVAGGLLVVIGVVRLVRPVLRVTAQILSAVVGGWLVVAPFTAGYGFGADSTPATANDVLIGAAIAALALLGRV